MDSPTQFQVGPAITQGKFSIVLEVGILASVPTLVGKRGDVRIFKSELLGIRHPFKKVGVLVESDIIRQVSEFEFFANLLEDLPILRSERGLVDPGLPAKVAYLSLLHLLHGFRALNVDGVFRFNAKDKRRIG